MEHKVGKQQRTEYRPLRCPFSAIVFETVDFTFADLPAGLAADFRFVAMRNASEKGHRSGLTQALC